MIKYFKNKINQFKKWVVDNECSFYGHNGHVVQAEMTKCVYKCDKCGEHYFSS